MPTSTDKLVKLKQQQEKLTRKIKLEQQRISRQARKTDTRRKIIAGALALTHCEQHPDSEFARTLNALVAQYVTKDTERALFGLGPLRGNDNDTVDQNTGQ